MKPVTLHRSDGAGETMYANAIIDMSEVVSIEDTVLDPKIAEEGAEIELPLSCKDWLGREISSVRVPAFAVSGHGRFAILHPMHVAANTLLKEIDEHKRGERTNRAVKYCVQQYYRTVLRTMFGKSGILSSAIFSVRVRDSARAVCLINADYDPEWIGVPEEIFSHLGLSEGSLVILGRDPTIWHGGMEVVRARPTTDKALEVHPLLFSQLGADCDGDEVYIYKVPDTKECQEEAEAQVLGFTQEHAKEWPSFLRESDQDPDVVWVDRAPKGTQDRIKMTGFSVSPEDIINQSDNLIDLDKRTGKDVAEQCLEIANGLSAAEIKEKVVEQNDAQLTMKMYMGLIGATSNRLKAVAGDSPALINAAAHLSERLQQVLLDTKHHKGTNKESVHDVHDVLDLFNRKNKFHSYQIDDAEKMLSSSGIDLEKTGPMLRYLWVAYPLIRMIHSLDITTSQRSRILVYIRMYIEGTRKIEDLVGSFINVCRKIKADPRQLIAEALDNRPGLADLTSTHYPLYDLITDSVADNPDRCTKVAKGVFQDGLIDHAGVNRFVFDIASGVIDVARS